MINAVGERVGSGRLPFCNKTRFQKMIWFSCMVFYETKNVVYNYTEKACGGPYMRRKVGVSYVVSREVYIEIGKKCLSVAAENEATIPKTSA